jgi:hypothetical protein
LIYTKVARGKKLKVISKTNMTEQQILSWIKRLLEIEKKIKTVTISGAGENETWQLLGYIESLENIDI